MTELNTFYLQNENILLEFGQHFARAIQDFLNEHPEQGAVIYLNGDLGAGKTTLTRSVVRQFGHQGNVKSPTYTLVEEYQLAPFAVYHFDLYRLADPEELEFMGIRDYFRPQTLCLLEWASKGEGMIPEPDIIVQLDYATEGRNLQLQHKSPTGEAIVRHFLVNFP